MKWQDFYIDQYNFYINRFEVAIRGALPQTNSNKPSNDAYVLQIFTKLIKV